jgi:UDP-glucose:(heptosyl)LPS alpha-1,3-glucosyltransferase
VASLRHVVLVRSTYSPSGGAERVALSLLQGLLQRDVRVTLLTLPNQKWPLADPRLEVVPVGISRGNRLIKAWHFNRRVNRYLSRHQAACTLSLDKITTFTHLHAGGGTHKTFLKIRNSNSNRLAAFIRRYSLFHNYILHIERKGFENPLLQKVRCNSRMVQRDIADDYNVPADKLVVVHSGIRWRQMAETYSRRTDIAQTLGRQYAIDPHWPALLFLGSGFERKGLDIAVQGLAAMPAGYHLIVVGKGAPQPYLRLAGALGLTGRVHFLGAQPDGWRFATLCKAIVLPSYYDPFGGAAAEGHAMGLPVLVSDRTGYADWVAHGQNGIVLKTPMRAERVRQAFEELSRLIAQPQWTAEQMREHARNVDDEVILDKLMTDFLPS